MDTLSHYLWVVALYWQHPKRWIIGLFGALPDLLSFGPHIVESLFAGTLGRPELHTIPDYVFVMYDLTHSLVVFAVVALVLWFAARDWFWLIWGWALHILIDIPTHSAEFFPTPFLWPISDFMIDGISWGVVWFMIMDVTLLVAVYTWLVMRKQRQNIISSRT
jgi:hypothetical protein